MSFLSKKVAAMPQVKRIETRNLLEKPEPREFNEIDAIEVSELSWGKRLEWFWNKKRKGVTFTNATWQEILSAR